MSELAFLSFGKEWSWFKLIMSLGWVLSWIYENERFSCEKLGLGGKAWYVFGNRGYWLITSNGFLSWFAVIIEGLAHWLSWNWKHLPDPWIRRPGIVRNRNIRNLDFFKIIIDLYELVIKRTRTVYNIFSWFDDIVHGLVEELRRSRIRKSWSQVKHLSSKIKFREEKNKYLIAYRYSKENG